MCSCSREKSARKSNLSLPLRNCSVLSMLLAQMYCSSRPFHRGRLLDNCYKIHSEYPSGWGDLWWRGISEYLVQLFQYFKNQNILGEQIFPAQGKLTLPSKLSQAEMSTRVLCEVEMALIKRKGLPNSAAPLPGRVPVEEGPRVHVAACSPWASSRSPHRRQWGPEALGFPRFQASALMPVTKIL